MDIKNSKQLGDIVKNRRKQLGVTQKDLALTCGSGERFIVDLEKGKPSCQTGMVIKVIQALGLTLQVTGSNTNISANSK